MYKRIALYFFASIGFFIFLMGILGFWTLSNLGKPKSTTHHHIPMHTIVTLQLGHESLREYRGVNFFPYPQLKSTINLKSTLFKLERAAVDTRVSGVLLVIEGDEIGLGQIQEIRKSLKHLRDQGKRVYVFSETFGELSSGLKSYYLASVADEIWLQPNGNLGISGIHLEIPFAKDILDALGVNVQIEKRGRYKSMPDSLLESAMTADSKENLQSIIGNLLQQITDDIASERKLEAKHVKDLLLNGPYLTTEALSHKLIDQVGHLPELKKAIHDKIGHDITYLTLDTYGKRARYRAPHRMAMVFIDGMISRHPYDLGDSSENLTSFNDDPLTALKDAAKNSDIKAIILRIDSGGGSAIASETLWAEVKRIRESGKPVIACLGNMAASGGYYIATAANKIIADPATLTGSIGVFGGKIVTKGLWERFGIHWNAISEGENSAMWSSHEPYSDTEKKKLDAWLTSTYDTFKQKVADGRQLTIQDVENIAQGRVWTGQQALDKKLIDDLGGIMDAITWAKKEAGLKETDRVMVETYPLPKTAWQKIMYAWSQDPTMWAQGIMNRIHNDLSTSLQGVSIN